MQIDWQKSEWQCVRMVVDKLIDQVTELSKQLQDSRRNYSDATSRITAKDNLISVMQRGIAERNRMLTIDAEYIEELRNQLIDRGESEGYLDRILEDIMDSHDKEED